MEAKQTVRELLDRSLLAVQSVIPAEAGIQVLSNSLRMRKMDAGLRRQNETADAWNTRNIDY